MHAHLHAVATGEIVALTLFLTGLVGGIGHCALMCGPFVLAQLRPEAPGTTLQRLAGWLLLPYQLGRATTYVGLGALAGAFGDRMVAATGYRSALDALLVLGAVLFLAQALHLGTKGRIAGRFGALLGRIAAPFLADPRGLRGYALGLALGFLPCGFLYAALAASAATGSVPAAALAMAAFAAGTAASLVAVAVAGRAVALRWRPIAARLATPVFCVNAAVLGGLAFLT
jgi:sulfite exporter TauE/SafE